MTSRFKLITGIIIASVVISLIFIYLIFQSIKADIKDTLGDSKSLTSGFINLYDSMNTKTRQKYDSLLVNYLDSIETENKKIDSKLTGEKVTILITGIDSRIGSTMKHADANHVIRIWFEPGIIEIISIPRGTWADAGFEEPEVDSLADSTAKVYTQNYLANVRAYKGRKAYFREIKRIAGIDKIDYYAEFGFSQAIGLLELIGFEGKSVQVLRVLRTRQVYGGQEHQRNYNQGQFIKQMIYKLFPILNGIEGEVIMRAALLMVDTNLNIEVVNEILGKLKKKGFPHSEKDIVQRVKPRYAHKYYDYDFTKQKNIDTLYTRLAEKSLRLGVKDKKIYDSDPISEKVENKLDTLIAEARKSLKKDPSKSIRILRIPFDQRVWFQVSGLKERAKIRKQICEILIEAYNKKFDRYRVKEVQTVLDMEEKVFRRFNRF